MPLSTKSTSEIKLIGDIGYCYRESGVGTIWRSITKLLRSDQIARSSPAQLAAMSDSSITDAAMQLKDQLLDGCWESSLAGSTFVLCREAARRCLGIEHRGNQFEVARHLLTRRVVELPTGEGKTLAATPALALRALRGRGVWLATANDYLARRDATSMKDLFSLLGLKVGYVQSEQSPNERRQAYACDITYGTIREFGFDFLRDRLGARRKQDEGGTHSALQRERFSIMVDEADSILLDDARTPLIISEPKPSSQDAAVFRWSVDVGHRLEEDVDYLRDPATTKVWMTSDGRSRVRSLAKQDVLSKVTLPEAYESVSRAIEAVTAFHLNRDYVIRDGKVVIVDRLTGRLAEGRQWQNGIQQSIEAANELEITPDTHTVAKVTIQAFLRGFEHLSGMTGTAMESRAEFRESYGLSCSVVSPHVPSQRRTLAPQVFNTRSEKWRTITQIVQEMGRTNRPVLIGTRDLSASEELSSHLSAAKISHQVLTAKQEKNEAELIALAGQSGAVTVSTSIAGRGTDIQLDTGVKLSGGLHVISADLFDSSRIDRQLAGRGGRQGDPATYQQILSLEDELLRAAWDEERYRSLVSSVADANVNEKMKLHQSAQALLERRHRAARRDLLVRDREKTKRNRELGFDPYLDDSES